MRWIREAEPGVLAAVIVGMFVVFNIVGIIALTGDPCWDESRAEWILAAAPLSGATVLVICARVTPKLWVAILASVGITASTALTLLMIVLVQDAELCAA